MAIILIRGLQFQICLGGCFTIQFSDEVGVLGTRRDLARRDVNETR